jgi:hypothetical protein
LLLFAPVALLVWLPRHGQKSQLLLEVWTCLLGVDAILSPNSSLFKHCAFLSVLTIHIPRFIDKGARPARTLVTKLWFMATPVLLSGLVVMYFLLLDAGSGNANYLYFQVFFVPRC